MTATADISDIGHTGVPYPATSAMHTTFHVTLQFSFHPIFRQFETALYGILHSILSLFTLYSPFPRTIRSFLYQFGQLSKPARPPPPPRHTHISASFSLLPHRLYISLSDLLAPGTRSKDHPFKIQPLAFSPKPPICHASRHYSRMSSVGIAFLKKGAFKRQGRRSREKWRL